MLSLPTSVSVMHGVVVGNTDIRFAPGLLRSYLFAHLRGGAHDVQNASC